MEGTAVLEGDGDVVGLEASQVGGGSGSPSRPSQITLKPLTINTDLVSPPNVSSESRRYVVLNLFSSMFHIRKLLDPLIRPLITKTQEQPSLPYCQMFELLICQIEKLCSFADFLIYIQQSKIIKSVTENFESAQSVWNI